MAKLVFNEIKQLEKYTAEVGRNIEAGKLLCLNRDRRDEFDFMVV